MTEECEEMRKEAVSITDGDGNPELGILKSLLHSLQRSFPLKFDQPRMGGAQGFAPGPP